IRACGLRSTHRASRTVAHGRTRHPQPPWHGPLLSGCSCQERHFISCMPPLPQLSRRRFLALAGTAAAGASLGSTAVASIGSSKKRIPIGIELYGVRSELSRDLPNTLKQVAKIGYEAVEFYSPYFQWTPAYARDVRKQLDDLGLRCLSTHNSFASFSGDGIAKATE